MSTESIFVLLEKKEATSSGRMTRSIVCIFIEVVNLQIFLLRSAVEIATK